MTVTGCELCEGPDEVRWVGAERSELVLYGSDHGATLSSLGAAGVRRVVDLWAERTTALGARPNIAYVLITEDGRGAGGAHPHGEIYGFADVPPVPQAELDATPCRLCLEDPGDRLVAEAMGWRAWAPAAPSFPYSVILAPMSHRPDLPALAGWERDALAQLLADIVGRFDRLADEPTPYHLWLHQQPTNGYPWPNAHVHVELAAALRTANAGELGSGVFFNTMPGSEAAAALREAGPTP